MPWNLPRVRGSLRTATQPKGCALSSRCAGPGDGLSDRRERHRGGQEHEGPDGAGRADRHGRRSLEGLANDP
eukprot:scaffold534272_cov34-Prasinocladus_malaysianus.AAC.1